MRIQFIAAVVIAALLMTGGVVTAAQVTEYGAQPTEEQKTTLTKEEAKNIALKHAGLKETEITGLRIEYDVERGAPEWDIDFRSGDWEYDYEIYAETGAVIKGEKEYDPVKATEPAPQETQPPKESAPQETKVTEPAKTETISAEEAKAIALKHAGLTESQVKGLWAEYDVDDGIPEWDVEFYAGGMEYDYEIHAQTGAIRSWEKERDD